MMLVIVLGLENLLFFRVRRANYEKKMVGKAIWFSLSKIPRKEINMCWGRGLPSSEKLAEYTYWFEV